MIRDSKRPAVIGGPCTFISWIVSSLAAICNAPGLRTAAAALPEALASVTLRLLDARCNGDGLDVGISALLQHVRDFHDVL